MASASLSKLPRVITVSQEGSAEFPGRATDGVHNPLMVITASSGPTGLREAAGSFAPAWLSSFVGMAWTGAAGLPCAHQRAPSNRHTCERLRMKGLQKYFRGSVLILQGKPRGNATFSPGEYHKKAGSPIQRSAQKQHNLSPTFENARLRRISHRLIQSLDLRQQTV